MHTIIYDFSKSNNYLELSSKFYDHFNMNWCEFEQWLTQKSVNKVQVINNPSSRDGFHNGIYSVESFMRLCRAQ